MSPKRKFDSIMELKKRGLYVGEIKEFRFSELSVMLDYARRLTSEFGGFSVRTDYAEPSGRLPINLPMLADATITGFEDFVEKHGDSLTYILYERRDYSSVLWQGRLWLAPGKVLRGEVNAVDRGLTWRQAMKQAAHLEQISCGPGGYDERFLKVRSDLLRAGLEEGVIADASAYGVGGRVLVIYKGLGRDF